MSTILSSLKFKRGNKADLDAMLAGVNKPKRGEPIWEIDTNRLKIGDGENDYSALPYFTTEASDLGLVISGWLMDGEFYQEESHESPWPRYSSKIYVDVETGEPYYYDSPSSSYHRLVEVAAADLGNFGLVRLYGSEGENADGAMTQKATTEGLARKAEVLIDELDRGILKIKP